MELPERRESDLGPRLWPGAEFEAGPGVVERYGDAPDLPGPIQAVGPADGRMTEAWCPQCKEALTEVDHESIIAVSPITPLAPRIMWPGSRRLAGLITVKPCGHAFRVANGQIIAEIREPAV